METNSMIESNKTRYDVRLCEEKDFSEDVTFFYNELEKVENPYFYCIYDPNKNINLYGNSNDHFLFKTAYSTLTLNFDICNEKTRRAQDPKCSSNQEINNWIKGKSI